MNKITLKAPYLIFLGAETDPGYAKTGAGLVQWRPELCKGQINLPGGTINLGLPQLTLEQAKQQGIRSLVIGTAAVGGSISSAWLDLLEQAAIIGLDIVAGVHTPLGKIQRLCDAAESSGAALVDVRIPPQELPVAKGTKRSGKRVLMVGTDCAVGKKYTALQMEKDMRARGMNADFRASGQTGIMIAGEGIPIDAVVSDFVSGAAELLSPTNENDHWDVIEGQGGIYHPGYSAVSLGLLIGSQPDAIVICHDAHRPHILGWPDFALPTIQNVIDRSIDLAKQVSPNVRCVGVSVNTSKFSNEAERVNYLQTLSNKLGLACVDPLKDGMNAIIDAL